MKTSARSRLAQVLAGNGASHVDAAMVHLPSTAVNLDVNGVGSIKLPVRPAQAKQLIAHARRASFGRGEDTLHDASVRDTWELVPEQVTLGAEWDTVLNRALTHFRDELGVPAGLQLRAELHSMLVYGKGQFFLPHQDSEKHDNMVATLVVSLPSTHTGGELIVDDRGTERVFQGSSHDLLLVAFYADRRHEVKPVRSGYRVTLTFNLMLTGSSTTAVDGPANQVARHLAAHFAAPASSRRYGLDQGEPRRLAFLLDHEYTQPGLTAHRFKGADAERVAILQAAAEQAGCETVLALADIRETWNAIINMDRYGHDWYEDDHRYRPSGQSRDVDNLDDLLDDAITLGWWVAPDGSGAESVQLQLGSHEVCAATPNRSLTPYNTEYEGYMGNYGNTVERWYRRAAVVMWPQDLAFANRAEAGSGWALATLQQMIDAGDLETARSDAASMAPFWHRIDASSIPTAFSVAAGLGDPVAARVMLAPVELEMLRAEHAGLVATVAGEYGDTWLDGALDDWTTPPRFSATRDTTWINDELGPLAQALLNIDEDALADRIGDRVWSSLLWRIESSLRHDRPDVRRSSLAGLGVPLARLLEAISDEAGVRVAAELQRKPDDILELLVPMLRAHRHPANAAITALMGDCRDRLTRLVEAPQRSADDWSIQWSGCGCEHCERLREFLVSPSEHTLEWPLAKPGRQHIHHAIDAAGLPVRHITRREGRPFTLVLRKTEEVFQRDQDARVQARNDLEWMSSSVP